MKSLLLQVDLNPIIQGATEVHPDNGSAYGYLIVVLLLVIAALCYVCKRLYDRIEKKEDEKEGFIEKSYQVSTMQNEVHRQVDQRLTKIENVQDTHTTLLQTLISQKHHG